MAKSTAKNGGMTVAGFARLRGVSAEAVRQAVRTGRITPGADGRIDPAAAGAEWDEATDPRKGKGRRPGRARADGGTGTPGDLPSRAESERKRSYHLAERARIDAQAAAGLLLRREAVERAISEKVRRTRDLLLAIPDRIDAVLAAESDPEACRRLVADEIDRALDELSGPYVRAAE
jgi:hypothetical protein